MKRTVLFRVDASVPVGTGHVMRCLALAQAVRDRGGAPCFVHAEMPPALESRLRLEGMESVAVGAAAGSVDDAAATVREARARDASWVVADGYRFGAAWQDETRRCAARLLVVDDYGHAERYAADIILNQNLGSDERWYPDRPASCELLLGPSYALLRAEFGAWRDWTRETRTGASRILVTLGGSDPGNVSARAIAAIQSLPFAEAVVVVGGSNPHLALLEGIARASGSRIRLAVNPGNMPELMAWADLAVSAAGSTSWELAFLGLPAVAIVLADNQKGIAAALAAGGVTHDLGWHDRATVDSIAEAIGQLLADGGRRAGMSARGRRLVDGRGAERVAERLCSAATAAGAVSAGEAQRRPNR